MKFLKLTLLLLFSLCLAACDEQTKEENIIHVRVAEQDFWIPESYFIKFFPRQYEERSIGLAVIYPEFTPLKESGYENKKERWYDGIRISIKDFRDVQKTPEELLDISKNIWATTFHSGEKMGMPYYTSPPNAPSSDHNEMFVFLEGAKPKGFLICSSKKKVINPQCNARFWSDKIRIEILFDKDFLQNWPDIKKRSFALLESFKTNPKRTQLVSTDLKSKSSTAEGKIYNVRVGEEEHSIPEAYFLRVYPQKLEEKSFGVHVIYPEFIPLSSVTREIQKSRPFDDVTISVHDRRNYIDQPEERLVRMKNFWKATQENGEKYGLKMFVSSPDIPSDKEEIYVYRDNNKLIGYFNCASEDMYANAQCSGEFWLNPTTTTKLHFDKDLLPNWKSIFDQSVILLDNFQTNFKGANQ